MAYLQNWDNSVFYKNIDDEKISSDIEALKLQIDQLNEDSKTFVDYLSADELPNWGTSIGNELQDIFLKMDDIEPSIHNLYVFVNSIATIDNENVTAKKLISIMQSLSSAMGQAIAPVMVFLARVDDGFINQLYAEDFITPYKFKIDYRRAHVDQLLPVAQENMLTAMAQSGLHAWGNLYKELSGTITGVVNGESYGLAKLSNMISDKDRNVREQSWHAIQNAWSGRSETSAAILNSINGWRIEARKKRSEKTEYHYLDEAVRDSHISRKTLDAMMSAVHKRRDVGHRALKAMQNHLKYDDMKPWDQSAPAPVSTSTRYTFDEAIDLIAKCFAEFNPEMGKFVKMMAEKGWIDAEPTDSRITGAYCTGFSEPREPRVFMTFEGTMSNVTTLAHELGHAWHAWIMRDMHRANTHYPMTLAETASIFAENLVRDYLFSNAKTNDEKLTLAWSDASSAFVMLNNIPARFDFDRAFVDARMNGFVPALELTKLNQDAWGKWYGDSLAEYDEYFWASKLHFSISGIGFYNYPYIFGYLFSLGVYQLKDKLGDGFNDLYTGLLRDTGNMTAEQVVMKHLGKDIETEDFWNNSLDMVEKMIADFEGIEVR